MPLRELDSNKHSVFLLFYHLILVVKYRKRVIDGRVSARLKEMFIEIGKRYGISLVEWGGEDDHIHCLFKAKPTTALARFINAYKSASSRIIKKEFPEIREQLWKEYFWSRSYCLLTSGGAPIEIIKEYIRRQGNEKSL
uniref:IS200/IS605 family transposase n=1 Tax=Thermocrinis ruber TaxID=75906 RepID=A0A7C5WZ69_9AQUI